jgi:hypothetical protein
VPFTKAEVYERLIRAGVSNGLLVVPEYGIKPSLEQEKRAADLAWCVRAPTSADGRPWLPVAVFEIEGHDAELRTSGRSGGIEKDADSILSGACFLREQTQKDLMVAGAVVLYQLNPDGSRYNGSVDSAEVERRRQAFATHVQLLCRNHGDRLPSGALQLGAANVFLDDELDAALPALLETVAERSPSRCREDGRRRQLV